MILNEADGPKYRAPISRAGGWSDAVIALAGNSADLAPVFRGNRPRTIRVRLCSTEIDAPCDGVPHAIAWNGETAPLTSDALRPGLLRIAEDDGSTDAWVRIVEAAQAEAVREAYENARALVRGWSLPALDAPLPSLDRLLRPILATVDGAR